MSAWLGSICDAARYAYAAIRCRSKTRRFNQIGFFKVKCVHDRVGDVEGLKVEIELAALVKRDDLAYARVHPIDRRRVDTVDRPERHAPVAAEAVERGVESHSREWRIGDKQRGRLRAAAGHGRYSGELPVVHQVLVERAGALRESGLRDE